MSWRCGARLRISFPVAILAAVFLIIVFVHGARAAQDIADCAAIPDDADRLACYDLVAGRKAPAKPAGAGASVSAPPARTDEVAATVKTDETSTTEIPKPVVTGLSFLARQWDLDEENRSRRFAIRPYRPNYILPAAYNTSPNMDASLDVDPDARAQNMEAKFQISFKVKLWPDIFGKNVDLWFAYSQLAFWQVYNRAFSSPFRETNYEPELLLNFRTDYPFLGFRGRFINVGLNHQSNGRSEPLSRSWNRVVANFGFERDKFALVLKTWYRIPEKAADDDNPDIDRYLGYGELWGYYFWDRHRFAVMVRNNLRPSDNRGAVQLEWSFPLIERVSGYVQYFNGYGESLIDYNHNVNRFSIGFVLTDWY